MHPDRAEREAGLVEPLSEDLAEVQCRLAEAFVGDRPAIRARQVRRNIRLVDRALSVDVRPEARGVVESSRRGASARRIGQCRHPALNHDADLVPLRLVRDEHVSSAPAWNRGLSVVPQSRVVVELERDERRRGARSHAQQRGGLPREPQVEERVGSLWVERRPRIEDVRLARVDTARLGREAPLARLVLLAAAREGRVLGAGIWTVVDAPGRLESLPIEGRLSVALVSVGALERAARQRAQRRRERRGPGAGCHQEPDGESAREHGKCSPKARRRLIACLVLDRTGEQR